MECLVKKDLFGIKVSSISKFAGDAKIVPVYGNMLLKLFANNVIQITCGDGNTFVTDEYNMLQTIVPGEVTVSAKDFSKLLNGLTNKEELTLKLVDNKLIVKSGKSEFKLNTIEASQYPELPTSYPEHVGNINVRELQIGLKCAKVCVAKDMTNPYLTGFKVDADLFSSDSLKICIYEENFGDVKLLVSPSCVDALLLANMDKMDVYRQGHSVLFKGQDFRVVSNMVGGIEKFPQSSMILSQEFDYMCIFNRQTMLPILNRASIFTVDDLSNAVKFIFSNGEMKIMSYQNKDGAGSFEIMDCDYYGEEFTILVDGKDFIDELEGLMKDEFELHFDSNKPEDEKKGFIKLKQDKLTYVLSVLDLNVQEV